MDVASGRYALSAPHPSVGCPCGRRAIGGDMDPVGHSLGGSHGDRSPGSRQVVAAEAQRIDGCDLGRPQHGRAHGQDALPRVGDRVASRGERYQRDGERPSGGECRQGDGRQKQPPNQVQACDSIGLPRRRHPKRPSRNARSCDPANNSTLRFRRRPGLLRAEVDLRRWTKLRHSRTTYHTEKPTNEGRATCSWYVVV